MVPGVRCKSCGYRAAFQRPRCPNCREEVEPASFGPGGVVWASTVVRIKVGEYEPPYGLAYVNVDDGPRVLAHTPGDNPARVGGRVTITGVDERGVISAEEVP